MKYLLLTAGVFLTANTGFSSARYDYNVEKLSSHSAAELEDFSRHLANTLNDMQQCPDTVKQTFQFGQQITEMIVQNDRSGTYKTAITAKGHRPAPSFASYTSTLTILKKIVPRKGPAPADAPPQWSYTCNVNIQQ